MTTQEPTLDEYGSEVHPAFGNITMNRAQVSPPGASLFDSEIRHSHIVTMRIQGASRKRDLNRDWIHPSSSPIIEVHMSEAQWASMVSSFHDGSGTSCTITYTREDGQIPDIPFAPRMEQSMAEVRGAANAQYQEVLEALKVVEEKPTKANIRSLRIALENAPKNVAYTARTMTEHAENVVQKARADIEAMVTAHAEHLGLDAADRVAALALGSGESDTDG
jgi:hypothetical protein